MSEDIRVLAETGNLSPRGENTGDAKKKRTRLSIARFRRSEMYSKTPVVQDQEGCVGRHTSAIPTSTTIRLMLNLVALEASPRSNSCESRSRLTPSPSTRSRPFPKALMRTRPRRTRHRPRP